MSHASDEQLAVCAQQGCLDSFEELVRRFQPPLLNFLRRRGAGADAEDLLQETFLRAYANLHRYRRRHRAAAWLFTIARRLSINHFHRAQAPGRLTSDGEHAVVALVAGGLGPAEQAAASEERLELWQVAARVLSEEEMTAVWLYYVEDFSAIEIGKALDRSWLATKSLLSRARKKLKPRLAHFHFRSPDRQPADPLASIESARVP